MTIEGMPLTLLVNPSAAGGKAGKLLPRVEAALDERRIDFRVHRTTGLESGVEAALRAVEAGEVPVAMSGDGLLGAVGGAMAGSDTPLGIVPAGRGNDLARVLGVPDDPEGAVAVAGRRREPRDRRRRGERGAVPGDRQHRDRRPGQRACQRDEWLRGNLVYVYAGIRTLIGWKPARFTIAVGEERIRFSGFSVSAANSRAYGGGMLLAPDAELDDGQFDVVSVGETGKLRCLVNLPKVFKGTHVEQDEVSVFRAPRLEVSASRPFPVYADGEHITDLPATLRLLPRALRVIVPPRAGE